MSAAAYLPPAPSIPVSLLPRDQVRSLAHVFGHHKRHAQYRFCALLPIVVRDKIYLDDGCRDEYEWAAKFGAMSREEVDRVLGLWTSIGEYHCLWSLLGEGVGISKLERVSPHVTPDNAGWMAQQVQRLTKSELEELMRSVRRSREGERKTAEPAQPRPGRQGPTKLSQVSLGLVEAPPAPDSRAVAEDPAAAAVSFEPIVGFVSGFLPEAADSLVDPGQAALDLGDTPLLHAGAELADAVASRVSRSRLTLEVDAIGEKRIRELQALYERLHGQPIAIGQLVSLLARWAIVRGELPSLEQIEDGTVESTNATPAPAPDAVVAEGSTSDAARHADAVPGAAAAAIRAPAGRAGVSTSGAKAFQPRLLEVVVSIAETGWRFVRTALGWVPVSDGAVAGFLAKGQRIPLENLRIAAIAASRVVSGKRYRPAAVDRYLLARSGGYCEVRGCRRKASAAHHSSRFVFDPSHHPDVLVCVCPEHHALAHKGQVRNENQDPMGWELLREGEDPELNPADLLYQAHSARS